MNRPKPFVLVILDGFGYREEREYNAIAQARTPNWDRLWRDYPHTLLRCSGRAVGLPGGQMGNSEVGHIHIGAGRLVPQDLVRIDMAIEEGSFFENPALVGAVEAAKRQNGALHLLGLLSPGGIHSHENHLLAAIELAARRGLKRIYLHAFLDGRDTPPKSAAASLCRACSKFEQLGFGRVASITGRYYAMDRDKRWERTKMAYDLLVHGEAEFRFEDPFTALIAAYDRGESDEFVKPTLIVPQGEKPAVIEDGDAVVFMNFRADRARQLTHALTDQEFTAFERRRRPKLSKFVTLTQYEEGLGVEVAFPPLKIENCLGEVLSRSGLTQLRLAETEKYAHVTYFLNGGREEPFPGEERIMIPSPKVPTYDQKPEMSAFEVTDVLVDAIRHQRYDVIICNYANGDMVGHTGVFEAAVKAMEAVDQCLGRVLEALDQVGGQMLLTADHGNAEMMFDPKSGQPHTAHTVDPVPLVYYRGEAGGLDPKGGTLADVAPTMLDLLGIEIPPEMTGRSLLIRKAEAGSAEEVATEEKVS